MPEDATPPAPRAMGLPDLDEVKGDVYRDVNDDVSKFMLEENFGKLGKIIEMTPAILHLDHLQDALLELFKAAKKHERRLDDIIETKLPLYVTVTESNAAMESTMNSFKRNQAELAATKAELERMMGDGEHAQQAQHDKISASVKDLETSTTAELIALSDQHKQIQATVSTLDERFQATEANAHSLEQKLQDGEDGIGALKKELDDLRYQIGGLTQQSNMMQNSITDQFNRVERDMRNAKQAMTSSRRATPEPANTTRPATPLAVPSAVSSLDSAAMKEAIANEVRRQIDLHPITKQLDGKVQHFTADQMLSHILDLESQVKSLKGVMCGLEASSRSNLHLPRESLSRTTSMPPSSGASRSQSPKDWNIPPSLSVAASAAVTQRSPPTSAIAVSPRSAITKSPSPIAETESDKRGHEEPSPSICGRNIDGIIADRAPQLGGDDMATARLEEAAALERRITFVEKYMGQIDWRQIERNHQDIIAMHNELKELHDEFSTRGQGQGAAKFDSEELLRTIKQQMDGLKEELEGKTIAAVKEELEALKQKQQRTDEAIGQIGVTFEDELMAKMTRWIEMQLAQMGQLVSTRLETQGAMLQEVFEGRMHRLEHSVRGSSVTVSRVKQELEHKADRKMIVDLQQWMEDAVSSSEGAGGKTVACLSCDRKLRKVAAPQWSPRFVLPITPSLAPEMIRGLRQEELVGESSPAAFETPNSTNNPQRPQQSFVVSTGHLSSAHLSSRPGAFWPAKTPQPIAAPSLRSPQVPSPRKHVKTSHMSPSVGSRQLTPRGRPTTAPTDSSMPNGPL